MNENTKARLIEGSLDDDEMRSVVSRLREEPALARELVRQAELDAALGVLLGSEAADRRAVGMALRHLRDIPTRRSRGRAAIRVMFGAMLESPLGAAVAAVVMLLLGSGLGIFWATKRTVPATSQTTDPKFSPTGNFVQTTRPAPADVTGSVWLDRLAAATATDMDGLFDAILAEPAGLDRTQALDWAVLRWAEIDPRHAMTRLREKLPDDLSLLGRLFDGWARLDAGEAWEATLKIVDAPARRSASDAVLTWLAKSDPPVFVKLAADGRWATAAHWAIAARSMVVSGAFGENEMKLIAGLAKPVRQSAIAAVADAMAESDAIGAVSWARSLSDTEDQSVALMFALSALAASDPERAGRELLGNPNRRAIAGEIVRSMGRENPRSALAWLRRHGGEDTPALTRELMVELVRNADNRSIDLLADLVREQGADVFRKDHRLDDIFWQARGLDHAKALGWIMDEAPRKAFGWENMRRGIIFSWAKEDRAAAGQWISVNLTEAGPREAARSVIVSEILSTTGDTRQAWDFNIAREAGPERGRMAVEIVKRHAAVDPAAAAEWLKLLPPEASRERAVESVASSWGVVAPDEAVAWAAALPSQNERVAAYGSVVGQWAQYDSWQASQWLTRQSAGPERDAGARALVEQIARFEGDSAFTWAMTIADSTVRQAALETAVRGWAQQNAAAARAAVNSAALTPSEKQRAETILASPDQVAPSTSNPAPRRP